MLCASLPVCHNNQMVTKHFKIHVAHYNPQLLRKRFKFYYFFSFTKIIWLHHLYLKSSVCTSQSCYFWSSRTIISCRRIPKDTVEFFRNTQSWQHWHLIQMIWTMFKEWKGSHIFANPNVWYTKEFVFQPKSLIYIFIRILWILYDAFELDANVANFVYYGKTRIQRRLKEITRNSTTCSHVGS